MKLSNTPFGFFGLFFTEKRKPWPKWIESDYGEKPPERINHGSIRYTFINHATVLLQTDSCNILTDPIWSNRCSPLSWAGPRRHRKPGIRFEDLPPIDVVLLSHNHYDHMDLPTLRRLEQRDKPLILSGRGNAAYLTRKGLSKIQDLDWWQQAESNRFPGIHFVPAKHFSGRGLFDRNKTMWGGFVIEASAGLIFFAGDTGYGSHFREIREKFGTVDLAFLPIGAYEPRSFMCPVHMNPPEAVQAHLDLQAKNSVGIHFGTFRLAFEGIDDPEKELLRARNGESFEVPQFGIGKEYTPDVGASFIARSRLAQ